MIRPRRWMRLRSSVKESIDNLPSGLCVFSKNGILVLCNYQMSRLFYKMMGHDLQSLEDLQQVLNLSHTEGGAVREGSCFFLQDGTVWRFTLNHITDRNGNHYTEAIAVDVTELQEKKKLLTEANKAKKQTIDALERIQQNIVGITREEEILAIKMRLHNEFGYNLLTIRRFFQNGCPTEEKTKFLEGQREILRKMRNELDHNDEVDPLVELEQLSTALDTEIIFTGEKPEQSRVRHLLSYAVRECLTNTLRHTDSNQLFVELSYTADTMTAILANAEKQLTNEIIEGGGLTSLRRRMENAGGTMTVQSIPRFSVTITVPMKGVM